MNDFSFSPANITIPAGGATLKLVNNGAATHNLQVADLGIKSPDVLAGETYALEVSALSRWAPTRSSARSRSRGRRHGRHPGGQRQRRRRLGHRRHDDRRQRRDDVVADGRTAC